MALDTRWKLPQGKTPEQLYDCIFSLIRELRKGDYLSNVTLPPITTGDIDFAATQRVLGRDTAGAGPGEEVTLTQLLDWIGSANRGDILRRGASAWESLNVGTSGQVLTSDGTDPAWDTPAAAPTFFQSAQQTITQAGSLTIAHGLGATPNLVTAALQCTTANGGYSIGHELAVAALGGGAIISGVAAAPSGVVVVPDATNLNVRYANAASTFTVLNFGSGAVQALTNASWRLVLRAWLFS